MKNFLYDELNRTTAEIWLDENNNPIHTINYQYDAASQLIGIGDQFATYSYTYDHAGRVASVG